MADPIEARTTRETGLEPGVLAFRAPASHVTAPVNAAAPAGEQALDAIHARMYDPLRAYACAYLSRDDAEDVVQGAFMSLWDRHLRHGVDGEKDYDAFLFNAARWRIMDFRRNRRTMREYLGAWLRDASEWMHHWMQPDSGIVDDRLARAITDAQKEMQPRGRELHTLHFFAGLSVNEIMEMTGGSRSSVSALLSRSNSIMRRHLEAAGYTPAALRAGNAGRKT